MRESISSLKDASTALRKINEEVSKVELTTYEALELATAKKHIIKSLKPQVLRLASMTKVLNLIQEYSKEVNGEDFEIFVDKGLLYVADQAGEFKFPIKGFSPSAILASAGINERARSHPVLSAYLETPEVATIIGAKMAIDKIKTIRG